MRVISFYSYKGGTGRTLLVANLAVYAARLGCSVVMVDLDLEAPGLAYKVLPSPPNRPGVLEWLDLQPYAYGLKKGLFGSSTGVAAALMAAAELPDCVNAIVSRGGRPDLAGSILPQVEAPTLFIVGGSDEADVELNEQALANMSYGAQNKLVIVPGASDLFEETGALEYAAGLARDWYQMHLDGVVVRQQE